MPSSNGPEQRNDSLRMRSFIYKRLSKHELFFKWLSVSMIKGHKVQDISKNTTMFTGAVQTNAANSRMLRK